MKRVTLADIAKKCGVSVNTVSHALNNKPDISEQKKEDIRKVADEMGYISNSAASFLRTGQSKSIGIIIGDIVNPSFSINLHLLEKELRRQGYSCIFYDHNEDNRMEKQAIKDAIEKGVDGIILCPSQHSEQNVRFLMEYKIPFVLMQRRFRNLDTNYVVPNDYDSGRQAAEYLLEKGCKKIACLMMKSYVSNVNERLEGIRAVYRTHKRKLSKEDCFYMSGGEESHRMTMDQILEADYDGVICFCDKWTMEFLSYAKRDIQLISFDGIRPYFFVPAKFASLGANWEAFCHAILEVLLDDINGKKEKAHIVFDTEIFY